MTIDGNDSPGQFGIKGHEMWHSRLGARGELEESRIKGRKREIRVGIGNTSVDVGDRECFEYWCSWMFGGPEEAAPIKALNVPGSR